MESLGSLKEIEVAAGLVFRNQRVLVAQRKAGDTLGGYWEFPGGKRQPGESLEDCLKRELAEELGIEVTVGPLFESIVHRYPEALVSLRFFCCDWLRMEPQAIGCADFAWILPQDLDDYRFPPADERLLERLKSESAVWGGPAAMCR